VIKIKPIYSLIKIQSCTNNNQFIPISGHLTAKSDVYSFGVFLLELLTGRRSVDKSRPCREQNLVDWARPILMDVRKIARIMDPALGGQYSTKGALKAAAVAYQCLSQNAKSRPQMSAVVEALEPLQDLKDEPATFMCNVEAAENCGEQVKENVESKENGNHNHGQRHKLYKQTSTTKELRCK